MTVAETPLLDVRNLRVEFATRRGDLLALEDVSLSISPGEILGVVGESGAGKSLLGLTLLGLLEPPARIAAGEIYLEGERLDTMPHDQLRRVRGRRIGAIFQDPLTALDPLFTVGQQLTETMLAHLPLDREQARADAITLIEKMGIPAPERRVDQYPHELSGGMRQRIVIALALCARPRLIIADEPTTALDVSTQAQIMGLLVRIAREQGTAIMLITHDMGVIAEAASRVAVLYAGRLAEIGTVQNVLQSPRHPYTTGLMGAIPKIGERRERLLQISGAMPRLDAIPPGCAFHPRCPIRVDRCQREQPQPAVASDAAACWVVRARSDG
jgi:peptide/nickel transport system ATP-binding protein